jgi:hypothetical protein
MALRAGDFDRCEIDQIDIQQDVTHRPDPFSDRPTVRGTNAIHIASPASSQSVSG